MFGLRRRILTIIGSIPYIFLYAVGYLRELFFGIGPICTNNLSYKLAKSRRDPKGYAPIWKSREFFYIRNIARRLGVFHQPIASVPGSEITLVQRESDDHFWSFKFNEDVKKKCVNLGSCNYLGFAEEDSFCSKAAINTVHSMGLSTCSTRHELGTTTIHQELERTIAHFLGMDDAITIGTAFDTNALNIPQLIGEDSLVLSDQYNHVSLILGLRVSGAKVVVFKHNDMKSLENLLRSNIIKGNPKTKEPWKKAFIVVEGIYSMEGDMVNLPDIIAIKKKYGAYLYLDEAHSVGTVGPNGRGVVDYFDQDPKNIDILMGTFAKSFGAVGGFIAGSKELISFLRIHSTGFAYTTSMSPPVAKFITSALKSLDDKDDDDGCELWRVKKLEENSKYFRQKLKEMGFIIYGHDASPVIPILLFNISKVKAFVTECLKYNVATVAVGFPATPIAEERARLCVSAGHSREQLDYALKVLDIVGDHLHLKYMSSWKGGAIPTTLNGWLREFDYLTGCSLMESWERMVVKSVILMMMVILLVSFFAILI